MSQVETESEGVEEQYAKILTNYDEMSDVFSKIRMRGTDTDGKTVTLVKDGVLYFEDGQVRAKVFDPMKSVWAWVRVDFGDIRREGKLVIGSISDFKGYLKRFGDKTIVEQTTDEGSPYIKFNDEDRKEGGYPAQDEAHVKSTKSVEDLPYEFGEDDKFPKAPKAGVVLDTYVECNVAEIQSVLNDGDTTEIRKYPVTVEDGHFQVRVGDNDAWIQTDFETDGEGEAHGVYGYGMDNVFSNLSGDVTIYMREDEVGPIWVHQERDGYTLDYMIAEDEE